MEDQDYSPEDIQRMRDSYPKLVYLLKEHPNSLPLNNGIAHIEKVLGMKTTVKSVDFSVELDRLIAEEKAKLEKEVGLDKKMTKKFTSRRK